jgi:hypothetical protein
LLRRPRQQDHIRHLLHDHLPTDKSVSSSNVVILLNQLESLVLLSLTLHQATKIARLSNSRLIRTLYRDGIFYYVYILRECTTLFYYLLLKPAVVVSIGNIVAITGPVGLLTN